MRPIILASILLLAGCSFSNEHGECIGIDDDPKPNLTYEIDTVNAVVSVLFIQSLFIPIVYLLECVRCPTGKAQ